MGQPQHIGDLLSHLLARRGYARVQSAGACGQAWSEAVGQPLAGMSRATQVKRGVLEVIVQSSTLAQEIGFRKQELIKRLAELLPDEQIRDVKCRVGALK